MLEEIVAGKKKRIAAVRQRRASLSRRLSENDDIALIAEVKRSSPSRGAIRQDLDIEKQVAAYEMGGASAISVVTEEAYFSGKSDDVKHLRAFTELPILRKDFVVDPIQIYESALLGADAILLIAAILDDEKLAEFAECAASLGMEAVVEVHTEEELRRALRTPAPIIGINNRNLRDFSVDLSVAPRLIQRLRALEPNTKRRIIAESGIKGRDDVLLMKEAGADAVLVGEVLVRDEDPAAKVRELLGR
ncbi:MAG TPA: indole-3-glycerol phosphate synthase TrpC [Thermosynergistes sp.]|nr:indole-3-glycerol phosphate synthase TrpC [Thermosynergistes sp.]